MPKLAANRERFDALYAQYRREVWAMAYARWVDADTAQDIAQEAFLRLWKQFEAREEILNPRAWLLKVTRNLAEDHAKSAFRRNGTQPPELLNGLMTKQSPALEQLERHETFERIRGFLEQLPVADREILTMKYALEYEAAEIAEALGIAVTAVHMRLSRARQRLAEQLSAHGMTTTQ